MGDQVNNVTLGTSRDIHRSHLVNPKFGEEKKELSEVRHTGFYYDAQLNDPTMIMSLHPSTYNDNGEWKTFDKGYDPLLPNANNSIKYSDIPIAVCLLSENPTFSVSNNFTDFNGGNPIEDTFNRLKPYAPLMGLIAKGAKDANTKNFFGSGAVDAFNKGLEMFGNFADGAEKVLNKALFVQGTRFTYYNGSTFSMNNLEMKFIKFSEYNSDGSKFLNVAEYIGEVLAPYCYGRYQKLSEDGAMSKMFADKVPGDIKDNIDNYVGLMAPPGGFDMSAATLDKALKGTLRLNIGGVYAIENLLIKNMTFSFSRSQAKNPEKPGETVPLYAEITLSLCPAAAITDCVFKEMLSGGELGKAMTQRGEENVKQLKSMRDSRRESFKEIEIRNY